MAICKVFYNHCTQNNISLKAENFTLSYDTNIPRQVTNRNPLPLFASFIQLQLAASISCDLMCDSWRKYIIIPKNWQHEDFSNIFLKCCS
jgi:hypothetical protein